MSRLSSSAKRDIFIILCCAVILVLLFDYRYDVSSRVLVRVDESYTWAFPDQPASNPSLAAAHLDEYGDPISNFKSDPSPPSHAHVGSNAGLLRKGKHRGRPSSNSALLSTQPASGSPYAAKDGTMGTAKVVWATDGAIPGSSLVRHTPGTRIAKASLYSNSNTNY